MTPFRPVLLAFLFIFSFFQVAGQTSIEQEIERNLSLRNQNEIITLCKKLGQKSTNTLSSNFYLSKAYLLLGNDGLIKYDSSLFYINKVIQEPLITEEIKFEAILFKIHVLLEKGNYKECIKIIQEESNSIITNDNSQNNFDLNNGNSFNQFNLNVELFNLYLKVSDLKSAKKLIQKIKDHPLTKGSIGLSTSYMTLGKYYLLSEKLDDAKIYYTKALNSYNSLEICNKVDAWHYLAEVEKHKGNFDEAMKIYTDLLKYEEKNKYKHGFIHTLLLAAETSLTAKKSHFEMAENVNKAYQFALKLNNKLRLVQAEMNMGYYFLQIQNDNSAIRYFNEALVSSEQIKAHYWTRSAAHFLIDIYTKKGDFKNAFYFQTKSITANEKLQDKNQSEKTELVKNIHMMYTYQHEMEKTAFELEKKHVHLIIWITISISTIGISILLLLQYIKQKRHNLFLTEKALKDSERKKSIIQPIVVEEKTETEPKTALDESIYLDLQEKLLSFIDAKGFLDPECSLTSMAKDFNTNTAYLSKYLNEVLNNSFNQLINEYRILDFIERVKNDKEGRKTFTIDHLASLSGFNSKSTFIRAFKKQTGIAPSVFLKSIEELS